jgi:TonB family protein
MRNVCLLIVALVALSGVAAAGDFSEPFAIADSRVTPEYPPAAQAAGFEGSVSVAAVVNTDGSVGVVEVIDCSSPNLGFEAAAIDAIRQWRFEPATEDGEAVDAVYAYVFHFHATPGTRFPAVVGGRFLAATSFGGVQFKSSTPTSRTQGLGPAAVVKPKLLKVKMPPGKYGALYDRSKLIPHPEGGPNHPISTTTGAK